MDEKVFCECLICYRRGVMDRVIWPDLVCPCCKLNFGVCIACRGRSFKGHVLACKAKKKVEAENAVGSNVGKDSGSGVRGGGQ